MSDPSNEGPRLHLEEQPARLALILSNRIDATKEKARLHADSNRPMLLLMQVGVLDQLVCL